MSKKPLGHASGSLNAPIAAFTMAIVLCSYCVYSINSARTGAQTTTSSASSNSSRSESAMRREQRRHVLQQRQEKESSSWVQKALQEKEK